MFTPRQPTKRRLMFTPRQTPFKRFRKTPTTAVRRFNRTKVRGPSTRGPLRTQVKALQKFANRFKPEKKFLETSLALTDIVDATGGIVNLVTVAEGASENERIGHVVNVSDIKVNVVYSAAATVTVGANSFVRFALVVDKEQVADTNPTTANVFSNADPSAFPTSQFLERFRILYLSPVLSGRMMILDTDTAGIPTRSNMQEYTWSGNVKVQFNGSAGTDIEKNGIYFCVLLSGFSSTLDTTGTARVGYTDV